MSDISFIDEDAKSPSPQSDQLLPPSSAAALVAAADLSSPKHIGGGNGRSTSAREALLFLRRGPSLNSGNHMPSSQEFAPPRSRTQQLVSAGNSTLAAQCLVVKLIYVGLFICRRTRQQQPSKLL
ncbi:hypothetical protein MTO96_000795 [Rhipicephalus appendiculatus]